MSKEIIVISLATLAIGGGAIAWRVLSKPALPPGFAGGNGRLEAKEIDISTQYAGRIKEILANEGDTVEGGRVVATMDTKPLEAQLQAANVKAREAQDNRNTALTEVTVKQSELDYADKRFKRSKELLGRGAVSERERDINLARADAARAALVGAKAQAVRTQSAIDAAAAETEQLAAEIKDNTLQAPVRARVQRRVAKPGEVLAAGGKVLTTTDLSDVYMYVFLPAEVSGRVALGSDARIVLDAVPEYPIKAVVSFVPPNAQFMPKTVATAEEQHNPSFRVKLQIDKERLRQYEAMVKVGVPGMGYVRFDSNAAWPPALQVNPKSQIPWNATAYTGNAPGSAGKQPGYSSTQQ